MSNGFKPPITKPSNCQTFYLDSWIIPPNLLFVKPFYPKNPIQNVEKCPIYLQKSAKKYRKVWKIFKNQEKRFEGLLSLILGNWYSSLIPRKKAGTS